MKFLVTGYGWVTSAGLDKLPADVLNSVVDVELSNESVYFVDVELEAARELSLREAKRDRAAKMSLYTDDMDYAASVWQFDNGYR